MWTWAMYLLYAACRSGKCFSTAAADQAAVGTNLESVVRISVHTRSGQINLV
jgi:hypothetical protein